MVVGRRLCRECDPVTVGEVGGCEGVEEGGAESGEDGVGEVRDFSHFHSSLYANKWKSDM